MVEEIGGLLGRESETFAESIADARDHFDQLLMPGWLIGGQLSKRVFDFQGSFGKRNLQFGIRSSKSSGVQYTLLLKIGNASDPRGDGSSF